MISWEGASILIGSEGLARMYVHSDTDKCKLHLKLPVVPRHDRMTMSLEYVTAGLANMCTVYAPKNISRKLHSNKTFNIHSKDGMTVLCVGDYIIEGICTRGRSILS